MTPAPLRVAFDLDGVLADLELALVLHAGILFGEEMTTAASIPRHGQPGEHGVVATTSLTASDVAQDEVPSPGTMNLTALQQRRLWRHVKAKRDFWETLDECEPGVVARLSSMAAERRWEIIFLTKRPAGAGHTAQVQTQRWLESKGFARPSVFVVQGSRGTIAEALALDVVVDDLPANCLDVLSDSNARAILVWRGASTAVTATAKRLGIDVVVSMAQCLDLLLAMHDSRERPSWRDRLKATLGPAALR